MPKLSPAEIDEFLTEPGHILRLGTVDDDGAARVVPIWFIYEDNQIWFTARENSIWGRNLRRDARVGLSIDEAALPYRKVTMQGTTTLAYDLGDDDAWRDRYRRIGERYLPSATTDAYIEDTRDQPRVLFAIDLTNSNNELSSWRLPLGGENAVGIWTKRYYRPNTVMGQNEAPRLQAALNDRQGW